MTGRKLSPLRDPEAWEWDGDEWGQCWWWLDMVVWFDDGVWWCGAERKGYGYDTTGKHRIPNPPKCRWPVRLLKRFAKLYPKGCPQ